MRFLAALITVGLLTTCIQADIPPPPPPKGKKYVTVDNSVSLEKVTGYVFVLRVVSSGIRPEATFRQYTKISLSEKPQKLPPGGRRTSVSIVAIPEEEAKKYATENELIAALMKEPVKGGQELDFESKDVIPSTDKRDAIPWTYTITAIDSKTGIKTRI